MSYSFLGPVNLAVIRLKSASHFRRYATTMSTVASIRLICTSAKQGTVGTGANLAAKLGLPCCQRLAAVHAFGSLVLPSGGFLSASDRGLLTSVYTLLATMAFGFFTPDVTVVVKRFPCDLARRK